MTNFKDKNHTPTRRRVVGLTSAFALSPTLLVGRADARPQTIKYPGVYIEETASPPNSVVPVATAIPAFVGYTEQARHAGKSVSNKAIRIESLADYHAIFGGAPKPIFDLVQEAATPVTSSASVASPALPNTRALITANSIQTVFRLKQTNSAFALYSALRLFYQNGGGACFVVSVGLYETKDGKDQRIDKTRLLRGLNELNEHAEPTLIVIPETTRLSKIDSKAMHNDMLAHCANVGNRFAILDMYAGHLEQNDPRLDPVQNFRDDISAPHGKYGAVYYPWVNTAAHQVNEFTYLNLTKTARSIIAEQVKIDEEARIPAAERKPIGNETSDDVAARLAKAYPQRGAIAEILADDSELAKLDTKATNAALRTTIPIYKNILDMVAKHVNCLPPAAGIAGIYTTVDAAHGVWKAPANVGLSSVVSTTVSIDNAAQHTLSHHAEGKSVNAIRNIPGQGVMVWDARTLDGNSDDWRYISVSRTIMFLKTSIAHASQPYSFEPNDPTTWTAVKSMIEVFLTDIWSQGGFQGTSTSNAFSVKVGLGETMTQNDLHEGRMSIEVGVAFVRPAEFVFFSVSQRMHTS